MKRKILTYIAIGVIVILVSRQFGKLSAEAEISNNERRDNNHVVHDKKLYWQPTQIGKTKLFIDAPYAISSITLPVKEKLIKKLEEMEIYKIEFPMNLENTITYFKLKKGDIFNNKNGLNGLLEGAFKDLKNSGRVKNIITKNQSIKLSNINVERADVKFQLDNKEMNGVFLCLGEKNEIWNFTFLINPKDVNSIKVINKIISSIRVDGNNL